jgi:hypothetical protein
MEVLYKDYSFRPYRPCLLMDRDEMSIRYRGPPIDASYKPNLEIRSLDYNYLQTPFSLLLLNHGIN